MKLRAVIVVDFEVDGLGEAHEVETQSNDLMTKLKDIYGDKCLWSAFRVTERRGDEHPDPDRMRLVLRN